ncbi:MAG: GNAT family N-acetyltransferase [Flavobacteriales bacterium]
MTIRTTERLVIRDLNPEDARNIFLLNSDPEVLRYTGDQPFADEEAAAWWIANHRSRLPHGIGRWSVELREGLWVGRCSLRRDGAGGTEMGYRLLRENWSKGYGTELARALIELAFSHEDVLYVVSKVAPGNTASIRVLEKCGARFWEEGPCERFNDALIYRMDRPPR